MAKRLFDLFASLLGLVVLSPLLFFVAVLVKLDSPGPVFYRGWRVGKGGRPLRIVKFRTMVADAGARGPGITAGDDLRVTRLGRVLRKTKIDELPQLINVVRGEMSLVGPRPEDPAYVSLYTPEQRKILSVSPGITSPASLRYRHEEALMKEDNWEKVYVELILPHKLKIELDYIDRRTFLTDVALIFRTFLELFH